MVLCPVVLPVRDLALSTIPVSAGILSPRFEPTDPGIANDHGESRLRSQHQFNGIPGFRAAGCGAPSTAAHTVIRHAPGFIAIAGDIPFTPAA